MNKFKNKIIGIVGAGAMGSGIAQVAATAGHRVVLYDNRREALELSEQKLNKIMNRLIEKGRIDEAKKEMIEGNIQYADKLDSFADCGLVIEAIVENLEIKKKVFAEIDAVTPDDCVLASNTSSLSITALAAAVKKPERFLGIHFFNPAPLMPLVEIVPGFVTEENLPAQLKQLMQDWGKVPVIAKDTPGFIVNRLARPFYGEALRLLEEGVADVATIDWAMKEIGGFRMGPFTLMDFIGLDVNFAVTQTVFAQFFYDPRYKPALTQQRLVQSGRLGRKSGRGFYDYAEGAPKAEPLRDKVLGQQIVDRILAMLINEAADALMLQIASAEDLDLAMTKGVNYPKGLLAWADEIGVKTVVKRLDDLYDEYHEDRYRCSPLLRRVDKIKK